MRRHYVASKSIQRHFHVIASLGSALIRHCSLHLHVETQREHNIETTVYQRDVVVETALIQRCFNVRCLLKRFFMSYLNMTTYLLFVLLSADQPENEENEFY